VQVLASAPPGSAWTFGGSILTFAFPMILVIVVMAALYVVYTKPEVVPGHQVRPPERPVSYTAVPGSAPAGTGQAAPAESSPTAVAETSAGPATEASSAEASAAEAGAAEASAAESSDGEAAGTGDAE
jgi:hypothetical protein